MSDAYKNYQHGLESPALYLDQIVPSDAADLARVTRALNVTVSGAIRVTTVTGDTATVYVAAGGAFPLRVRKVWATGTDAAGIVGLS